MSALTKVRPQPDAPAPPGLRPLVVALAISIATGIAVAVATLTHVGELIAVARAADPTQTEASASSTLFSRVGVSGAVVLIYPLLLRRLARGTTRVYARIQRAAAIAAVALLVVIFLGPEPGWLHALQGVQAAAQLGVVAATLRPELRNWYLTYRTPPVCPGAWRPILLLIVLAPLCAEVSIGNVPFSGIGLLALVLIGPIYSAGALLVREAARRTGGGWPAILLLGVTYCLLEEGVGLQALFSPTIYHGIGPELGARVAGVNGVYLLLQLLNHAVWSLAVPIALTELTFRDTRALPWLGRPGLIVTGVLYVFGVGLTLLVHLQSDPDYFAPLPALIGTAVLALLVAVLVLTVLPRLRRPAVRRDVAVPRPAALVALGFTGAFAFLALLNLPGRAHLALVHGPGVLVPIVLALAVAGLAAVGVARWSGSARWQDVHLLALAGGALLGHSAMWGLILPQSWATRIGVLALFILSAALLYTRQRALVRHDNGACPGH